MLLAVALVGLGAPWAGAPQDVRHICWGSPDPGVVHPRHAPRHGLQSGLVRLRKVDHELEVSWRARPEAPQGRDPLRIDLGALDGPPDEGFEWPAPQGFACGFSPTAFVPLGSHAWIVAGHERQGPARIERWELGWPEPMPGPECAAKGRLRVRPVEPERTAVVALWTSASGGPERPVDLEVLRRADGRAHALVVLFSDARELRRLDLAAGELKLLASPVRAGAPLGLLPLRS